MKKQKKFAFNYKALSEAQIHVRHASLAILFGHYEERGQPAYAESYEIFAAAGNGIAEIADLAPHIGACCRKYIALKNSNQQSAVSAQEAAA